MKVPVFFTVTTPMPEMPMPSNATVLEGGLSDPIRIPGYFPFDRANHSRVFVSLHELESYNYTYYYTYYTYYNTYYYNYTYNYVWRIAIARLYEVMITL